MATELRQQAQTRAQPTRVSSPDLGSSPSSSLPRSPIACQSWELGGQPSPTGTALSLGAPRSNPCPRISLATPGRAELSALLPIEERAPALGKYASRFFCYLRGPQTSHSTTKSTTGLDSDVQTPTVLDCGAGGGGLGTQLTRAPAPIGQTSPWVSVKWQTSRNQGAERAGHRSHPQCT